MAPDRHMESTHLMTCEQGWGGSPVSLPVATITLSPAFDTRSVRDGSCPDWTWPPGWTSCVDGKGLRVNELQPGVIDTEMTQAHPEGTQKVVDNGIPMGRVGTGREIATAVAFLLSDEASYINGAHIAVDGGFLA